MAPHRPHVVLIEFGGNDATPEPDRHVPLDEYQGLLAAMIARCLGAADVVSRHALKPYDDLTAVAWSERLERLLVIAESADRLLVVTPDGAIDADETLPGGQQEGLALGPDGALWAIEIKRSLAPRPKRGWKASAPLSTTSWVRYRWMSLATRFARNMTPV